MFIITFHSSDEISTGLKKGLSISANVIYCLTTVVLISYYKDIVFALTFLVIEVGYLAKSPILDKDEVITAIVLLSFIFISVVTSIFRDGKLTFGYQEEETMDNLLEKQRKLERSNTDDM